MNKWSEITSDTFILNCLRGYQIPFSRIPSQRYPPKHNLLNKKDEPYMNEVISKLVAIRAIKKTFACKQQFVSFPFDSISLSQKFFRMHQGRAGVLPVTARLCMRIGTRQNSSTISVIWNYLQHIRH